MKSHKVSMWPPESPRRQAGAMSYLTRFCMVRQITITKGIVLILFFSVVSLLFLYYQASNYSNVAPRGVPPEPTLQCRMNHNTNGHNIRDHSSAASLRIDNKVLVLVETQYSKLGQEIIVTLEANRLDYKMELAGKSLPYLTHMDKGKFGVIVFENLQSYVNMDKWNRQLLDKYCREYDVGMIAFTLPTDTPMVNVEVKGFPLTLHTNLALKDYEINGESEILRVTRAGEMFHGFLPGDDWTVFSPNHTTYEPLAYAHTQSSAELSLTNAMEQVSYVTALQDLGLIDGIQRVFFGNGLKFWLHRLLFLDALSCLSHGKFSIPLERYVLIDIDDIFVGKSGTRMIPADVKALLHTQRKLQRVIKGFHFNLGFSGKYFRQGTETENEGDDLLIEYKDKFWWFPHMWRHLQPHKLDNVTLLENEMRINYRFAKFHEIPVNWSYAVAPHHSGVYPVHEQLYESWKKVWDIRITSTEEYPHLRPARYRRGFIHKDIMVLPRQTCGLFTHTIFIDKYPGGRRKLEHSIHGGELFQTFLYNPINVFMTHLSNYGNDRLALYTFESVIKFIQCWTNLQVKSIPPLDLGKKYFQMYPMERDPVWGNPCDDKRHLSIWSEQKTCNNLPRFLVIGPQKTGTTALYTFLSMHPSIASNLNSQYTFEEVQFFNGKNYYRGLDWYLGYFPTHSNTSKLLFEKSATYFDSELAPLRASAMLPQAKIITILISPAKRAYSWYQHQRAHKDKTAMSHSFYEVISADEDAPRSLRDLRNRCLNPGIYAQNLESWLDYYPPKQILILDGELLRNDPIAVMDKVQLFLNVEPFIDYSKKLRYNPGKGFFCQVVQGKDTTKCLGQSKGRRYEAMEDKSFRFLRSFYRRHNVALSKLLSRLGLPIPQWLEEELSDLH